MRKSAWLTCLILVLALCLPAPSHTEEMALLDLSSAAVRWTVQTGDFEKVVLTISRPDGKVIRREIQGGEPIVFELGAAAEDGAPKDGTYKYELRGAPRLDASVRKELAAARKAGNEAAVIERLQESGRLPREGAVQSGSFLVQDGAIVPRNGQEEERPRGTAAAAGSGAAGGGPQIVTAADQVIPDDLIVQGSTCVGLDCVNNENFGFDTIRMRENNLRIKFDDTSTTAGFPNRDWQLTANESDSGTLAKFSIEDITGARVPFTVEAGATTNSIYIDSTGRVGLRSSTPVLDLHINTSNTPAIRLEQNNSGGFTAQTWDIGGNEANFFVRDVTSGSRMPLRIRPGAPTSSLDISADGEVGIGTGSPDSKLHVLNSSGGDAHLHIEETNGTTANRTMLEIENRGGSRVNFLDTATGGTWAFNNIGDTFNILRSGAGVTAFALQGNGTLTVVNLIESSDRDLKTDIVAVQPEEILAKVSRLPLSTWRFKNAGDPATHLGPMAQDFSAIFGLGQDDKHIKALDVAGVSLAAVQALHRQVSTKDAEIADLKSRIESLEKLVQSLASAGPQP